MRCGSSELDHPARYEQNTCLLLADAMTVSWNQARDRYRSGLWPAQLWEAYQRGHAATSDQLASAPTPPVAEWMKRLAHARANPIRGALYQLPVPLV